jgi:hypothetical protein
MDNVGPMNRLRAVVVVCCVWVAACSPTVAETTGSPAAPAPPATTTTVPTPPESTTTSTTIPSTTTTISPFAPPAWLGTRLLPLRPDGFGEVLPTPPELADRRLETIDLLAPPAGTEYEWTAGPIPGDVLARSSWHDGCPLPVEDLTYLTLSHFGFDGAFHTGELIVNAAHAEDFVEIFRKLHQARFPIEQMRVIRADEVDEPPTGDGNVTTAFTCRPATGSSNWSMHAYGLAIDINPFHNPYLKGDLVLPELASVYTERSDVRPGMVTPHDVVTEAFAAMGWRWGGNWNTLKDWMHFSSNGR